MGSVSSVTNRSAGAASIPNGTKGHARKRSDISIISATVPSSGGTGNFGLYALKCDRNAAKRGILLNLPRKMAAVVGGETNGCYQSEEMVHEKFSPCKKTVEPPPRRKKLRKRQEQQQSGVNPMRTGNREMYCGDRLLERNRSELFRIAEQGSNEQLNRRDGEHLAPPARALSGGRKARSVDNILTLKKYYPEEEGADSDSDAEQMRSLRVGRMREWNGSRGLKYSESMESDSEEVGKVKRNVRGRLKKATDFSIDNNSDEIEVRFRRNESTESEAASKPAPFPLPTRLVVLRQEGVKPEVKPKMARPKLPAKPPPKKVDQFVSSQDFADNFKPLASVLQESIKSAELKRKWINDFLSESDDEPVKPKQAVVSMKSLPSNDSLSKKFELVDKFDRQLDALETKRKLTAKESEDSVNIFKKTNADFDEFDKLFNGDKSPSEAQLRSLGSVKKSVTVSERISYMNQQKTHLYFSSSSMDSDVRAAPVPPPLPPPVASWMTYGQPKSTVNIQDYYDKKLQRVRYVSSPSPSRCFDEDSSTERTEAVNNNIVLPLSIINRTIVDNCITTEQVPKRAIAAVTVNEPNQNIYPETYNQASNDHISCYLNNIDGPSYVGLNQATNSSATSHSHNVFIVGKTFKRNESSEVVRSRKPTTTVKRYINYNFDDYCHIGNGKGSKAPPRVFNINDFHDECYNEEGVVII